MKKGTKILKNIIIILVIILLSIVAFLGVFSKNKGVWSNIIPEYKYGMELGGTRELRYKLNDEEEEKYVYIDENGNVISDVLIDGSAVTDATVENVEDSSTYTKEKRTVKANEEQDLTRENFNNAKKIIVDRLEKQGIEEYNIRLDDVNKELAIETQNNDSDVGKIETVIEQIGKLTIVDYQNGELLMDNSDIKNVSAIYATTNGYQAYLQIEFNKNGAQKLKDISNKYVETEETETESEDESTEENETETATTKKVSLVLDGSTLLTACFEEEMSNGILQISLGSATTDYDEFMETYEYVTMLADTLNTGVLPIDFELQSDNYVRSGITQTDKIVALIIALVAIVAISVYFIIKFKLKGVFANISAIGYIATLSIVSRYTNVLITLNSLISFALIVGLNYLFIYNVLKNVNEKNNFASELKKFYLNTLPVSILGLVFIFTKYAVLNSVGMVVFWGMVLIALYNVIFTKMLLKK